MEKFQLDKNRLRERREQLNISKQEAARRMNMSQPAYLRYESGNRIPSIHIINTIADVLQTSPEYLTGQTNNPTPTSYIIRQKEDPQLFHIIEIYKNADSKIHNRLLHYLTEFERNQEIPSPDSKIL